MSLLWFGAIVALIPLSLWLLKRTPLGGGGSSVGTMRSVAVLPLSTSQRIVTIEVGSGNARRWLVLGVSPQQISTLHTMEPPPDTTPVPPPDPPTSFAALLGRMRQRQ
jgi:flagellar protein FliO/FliZ